jgi:hypothetical protein
MPFIRRVILYIPPRPRIILLCAIPLRQVAVIYLHCIILQLHYDSKPLEGVNKMEHVLEQKNHYIRPGPATAITFSIPLHNCLQLAHKHLSIGLCLGSNLCYPHVSILVTCRLRLHTLGVVRLTLLNLNITGVSLGLSGDLSWSRSAYMSLFK